MKYWCYYANVVRYLEKVEALLAPITRGPAYLVWTDDDGPHMIAGPGIHWYRGDGPMPDLDSLEIPVGTARASKRSPASARSTPNRVPTAREGSACARSTRKTQLRAARVSKRSPANAQSTRPTRQCRPATWRKPPACRVEPPAHHNRETSVKPTTRPPKKANKRRTVFPKPAQTCSPRGNEGGEWGQSPNKGSLLVQSGERCRGARRREERKRRPKQVAVGSRQTGRGQPIMCRPPLAVTVCPVMKFDSSERRKRAKLAISSA